MTPHPTLAMLATTAFLALSIACSDPTTGSTTTDATDTPDTADTTDRVLEDVSDLMADVVESSGAPAVAGGIVDAEGLYAIGAAGVRNLDAPDEVTLDDRWHLGSDTKAMTATLVGTFVDDGDLTFDSTLAELFPEVAVHAAWDGVTMADLLRHRAGVGDVPNDTWSAWWAGGDVETRRADYVEEILTQPPLQPVGTYYYSNGGYVIAGAALEAMTGESWEALMEQRLFAPLGMNACGFGPPPAGNPSGHDASGTPMPDLDNPPTLGPAGTVHCTMQSWARFAHANLDGSTLLEPATLARIHDAPVDDYALGWSVADRPWGNGTVIHHIGSNTLWYAWVWVAPEIDRAYLAVTNSGDPDHLLGAVDAAIGQLISYDQQ